MTRFEIQPTPQPLKLMRLTHSRTRLPRRLGEPGFFYRKFPRARPRVPHPLAERAG